MSVLYDPSENLKNIRKILDHMPDSAERDVLELMYWQLESLTNERSLQSSYLGD